MSSIRQKKVGGLIQEELADIFRRESRTICMGAMVTVTVVNVVPDLSFAKVYLSLFGVKDTKEVFENINEKNGEIRYELGKRLGKSLRRIPELSFHVDDSLDYANEINELLK